MVRALSDPMNETLVRSDKKSSCGSRHFNSRTAAAGRRSVRANSAAERRWWFTETKNCRSKGMNYEASLSEGHLHRKACASGRGAHKLLLLINAILALVALSAKAAGY